MVISLSIILGNRVYFFKSSKMGRCTPRVDLYWLSLYILFIVFITYILVLLGAYFRILYIINPLPNEEGQEDNEEGDRGSSDTESDRGRRVRRGGRDKTKISSTTHEDTTDISSPETSFQESPPESPPRDFRDRGEEGDRNFLVTPEGVSQWTGEPPVTHTGEPLPPLHHAHSA